ncbi:MAG: hypothetical protein QM817_25930 [Archangium sp.]
MPSISPQRAAEYSVAISKAQQKQFQAQAQEAELPKLKAKRDELEPQFEAAKAAYKTLQAKYDKASPAQKKKLEAQLDAAKKEYFKKDDEFGKAESSYELLNRTMFVAQSESLGAQKNANAIAKELNVDLPFPLVDGFESMDEARSMSKDRYAETIGGVSHSTKPVKVDSQIDSISRAAKGQSGPQVLADKLLGASPEAQRQILEGAKADIDVIAERVAKGYSKDIASFSEAVKNLDPSLKQVLVKALAAKVKEVTKNDLYGVKHDTGDQDSAQFEIGFKKAIAGGKGADLAGPLLAELKATGKPRAAEAMAVEVAEGIGALRKDFQSKKAVVDDVQGDIARMVYGFQGSLSKDQLAAGMDAIKARHTEEFGKLDASVKSSLDVLNKLESLPLKDYPELNKAAEGLKTDIPKLLSTNAGEKELKSWMKQQVLGNPSPLDQINTWAGNGKQALNLKNDLSGIVINAAGSLALEGGGITKATAVEFLKRNQKLLGIDGEKAKELAGAMKAWDPDNKATQEALEKAVKDLPPESGKLLKALNVALALPGVVQGWRDFGDASLDGKLKTLIGTGSAGVDTAALLTGFFAKSEKYGALAKTAGEGLAVAGKVLGVASSVLDGVSAVKNFAQGNYVDGAADGMSAAGGLMMLGGPGGVAAGAALILGSFIVRGIWGTDPAEVAEKADEADAKAFLKAGGMSDKLAGGLSDLLQSNRRNVGTFVTQVAGELKITPQEFVKRLEGLDAGKIKELVNMVKNMPADDEWKYSKEKKDVTDVSFTQQTVAGYYFGPKSLQTAVDWMQKNGIAAK